MAELIRCAVCEGWGITSYEKDGAPNKCAWCNGAGKVQPPAPIQYALTDCQAAIKEVLDLAEETTNSNNAEARGLAELVVKLFEDFELVREEHY